MPKSPEFLQLLEEIKILHEKKNDDYTTNGTFENFERMAEISSWFRNEIDKSFANLVAVKLARLGSLLGRNKVPNNESIIDSFKDITTYCALWAAYHINQLQGRTLSISSYDDHQAHMDTVKDFVNSPLSRLIVEGKRDFTIPLHNQTVESELWKSKRDPGPVDSRDEEILLIYRNLSEEDKYKLTSEARRLQMFGSKSDAREETTKGQGCL
jgi:hypothetical protein